MSVSLIFRPMATVVQDLLALRAPQAGQCAPEREALKGLGVKCAAMRQQFELLQDSLAARLGQAREPGTLANSSSNIDYALAGLAILNSSHRPLRERIDGAEYLAAAAPVFPELRSGIREALSSTMVNTTNDGDLRCACAHALTEVTVAFSAAEIAYFSGILTRSRESLHVQLEHALCLGLLPPATPWAIDLLCKVVQDSSAPLTVRGACCSSLSTIARGNQQATEALCEVIANWAEPPLTRHEALLALQVVQPGFLHGGYLQRFSSYCREGAYKVLRWCGLGTAAPPVDGKRT